MKRWAYCVVYVPKRPAPYTQDLLNLYGAQGWELVSISGDVGDGSGWGHDFTFKRAEQMLDPSRAEVS